MNHSALAVEDGNDFIWVINGKKFENINLI